ncbi:MAG: hypothetical protein ACPKPY_02905 [Nitrososphaeraceae archaeon]
MYTESIRISEKRLNGIKLRAVELHRSILSETLDVILNEAGIPELTSKELEVELERRGKKEITR